MRGHRGAGAAGKNSLHATVTDLAKNSVGVDSDEPSVRLLTERGVFDNLVHADATTVTRADIDLPSVDVVLAGDIIEHLTEPGLLFDTVDRVCEPNSTLLISTLNALGLAHTLRNLRGRPLEEGDHVCSFTPQTFAHMIQRKGWVIEEMWTCYQPLAQSINPRSFAVARRVFEFAPRLGGSLLAVCRRAA